MTAGLCCFGGPLDGMIVATQGGPPLGVNQAWPDGDEELIVEYHLVKFAAAGVTWRCWLAPGYPTVRIVDGLNIIAGLAALWRVA